MNNLFSVLAKITYSIRFYGEKGLKKDVGLHGSAKFGIVKKKWLKKICRRSLHQKNLETKMVETRYFSHKGKK